MNKISIVITFFFTLLFGCHRKLYNSTLQEIQQSKVATISATQITLDSESVLAKKPIGYFYNTLYGLDENYVTSAEKSPAIFYLQRPTLVYQSGSGFPLVLYPEDSLNVEYDIYADENFMTDDKVRKSELQGFGAWCSYVKSISYGLNSFYLNLPMTETEALIQTNKIKSQIRDLEQMADTAIIRFRNQYNLSASQENLFLKYKKAFLIRLELDYYSFTRKYSAIDMISSSRYANLILYFNSFKSVKEIDFSYRNLWEILRQIMANQFNTPSVYDQKSMTSYLEIAKKMFSGISYNYLTANIIYKAYKNKIITTKELLSYSKNLLKNKYYQASIRAIASSYSKSEYFVTTTNNSKYISKTGKDSGVSESEIFEKFKGKLVFVDFWASWCVPCRREMPAMRELKRQYLGKDIVFITISIDKDLLAWQKAHKSEQLADESSYLMNTQDSVFVFMNRKIELIPRYFLLNKDGGIISDNAPGPAEDGIKKLIDTYINRN